MKNAPGTGQGPTPPPFDLDTVERDAIARVQASIDTHAAAAHASIADQAREFKRQRRQRALDRFTLDKERAAKDATYRMRKQVELMRLRMSLASVS